MSARNSIRHGALSRTVVLDEENGRAFRRLLETLHAEFAPATPSETALVENMAVARWRQLRLWGMEKAGLDHEIRNHQHEPDAPTRAALAFRTLSDESRSLELLNRYETRYDRQFSRALARLLALKHDFSKRTQFPPTEPGSRAF